MCLQLVPCAVLAFFIHPRTMHLWINRALWAFCVYLEAVSVLPQLRLMQNTRVTLQSLPLSLLDAILLYHPLSSSLLLGANYTMAEGHDHELVRAFETHPTALPWKFEIEFLCGHRPSKCSVKTSPTGLSTKCYFFTILSMWGPSTQ